MQARLSEKATKSDEALVLLIVKAKFPLWLKDDLNLGEPGLDDDEGGSRSVSLRDDLVNNLKEYNDLCAIVQTCRESEYNEEWEKLLVDCIRDRNKREQEEHEDSGDTDESSFKGVGRPKSVELNNLFSEFNDMKWTEL